MNIGNPEPGGLALGDYLQMVWHRKWLIAAITIAAAAIGFATRPPTPVPTYQATATLRVQTFTVTGSGTNSIVPVSGVPPAEVQAARSVEVAAETAQELGLDDGGPSLLNRLVVIPLQDTDLLQLSFTGRGQDTVDELQTYATNYVTFRNEQDEARIERALGDVDARIDAIESRLTRVSRKLAAEDADGDPSPKTQTRYQAISALYTRYVDLREQIQLDYALAGNHVELLGSPIVQKLGAIPTRALRMIAAPIAGFLIGCALAIALGVLRPRVTNRERTEQLLGYPVVATIPSVRHRRRRLEQDPLLIQRLSAWGTEGVRMLRTELQLVEERGKPIKSIVVVSPEPRDGKTTVAVNLAAAYAAADKNVVLVHADVRARRRGRRHSAVLVGQESGWIIHRHPTGFDEAHPPAAGHGGAQDRLPAELGELANTYDVVVVDTPPLPTFADGLLLASQADAVVLVVRYAKTAEDRAAETLEILARHDAPIAGIVLNGTRVPRIERYRYRRYYSEAMSGGSAQVQPKARPRPPRAQPPPAPATEPEPVTRTQMEQREALGGS